jgi:hypothetical protein
LADKGYYKQKGAVKKVINKYVGEIEMEYYDHISFFDILLWGNGMQILLSTWKVVGNGYRYCSVPGIVVDLAVTTHK